MPPNAQLPEERPELDMTSFFVAEAVVTRDNVPLSIEGVLFAERIRDRAKKLYDQDVRGGENLPRPITSLCPVCWPRPKV